MSVSARYVKDVRVKHIDLHVFLIALSEWNEEYCTANEDALSTATSLGFIQVAPSWNLYSAREVIAGELKRENPLVPDEFTFVRAVGRIAAINRAQEHKLKAGDFAPEIFLIPMRFEDLLPGSRKSDRSSESRGHLRYIPPSNVFTPSTVHDSRHLPRDALPTHSPAPPHPPPLLQPSISIQQPTSDLSELSDQDADADITNRSTSKGNRIENSNEFGITIPQGIYGGVDYNEDDVILNQNQLNSIQSIDYSRNDATGYTVDGTGSSNGIDDVEMAAVDNKSDIDDDDEVDDDERIDFSQVLSSGMTRERRAQVIAMVIEEFIAESDRRRAEVDLVSGRASKDVILTDEVHTDENVCVFDPSESLDFEHSDNLDGHNNISEEGNFVIDSLDPSHVVDDLHQEKSLHADVPEGVPELPIDDNDNTNREIVLTSRVETDVYVDTGAIAVDYTVTDSVAVDTSIEASFPTDNIAADTAPVDDNTGMNVERRAIVQMHMRREFVAEANRRESDELKAKLENMMIGDSVVDPADDPGWFDGAHIDVEQSEVIDKDEAVDVGIVVGEGEEGNRSELLNKTVVLGEDMAIKGQLDDQTEITENNIVNNTADITHNQDTRLAAELDDIAAEAADIIVGDAVNEIREAKSREHISASTAEVIVDEAVNEIRGGKSREEWLQALQETTEVTPEDTPRPALKQATDVKDSLPESKPEKNDASDADDETKDDVAEISESLSNASTLFSHKSDVSVSRSIEAKQYAPSDDPMMRKLQEMEELKMKRREKKKKQQQEEKERLAQEEKSNEEKRRKVEAMKIRFEEVKAEKVAMMKTREQVVKQVRQLTADLEQKETQAVNTWRKKCLAEKKRTDALEESTSKQKKEIELMHQKLSSDDDLLSIAMNTKQPMGKGGNPSQRNNHLNSIRQLNIDCENLKTQIESTNRRLTEESKKRNIAQQELKEVREKKSMPGTNTRAKMKVNKVLPNIT